MPLPILNEATWDETFDVWWEKIPCRKRRKKSDDGNGNNDEPKNDRKEWNYLYWFTVSIDVLTEINGKQFILSRTASFRLAMPYRINHQVLQMVEQYFAEHFKVKYEQVFVTDWKILRRPALWRRIWNWLTMDFDA